ncbi:hypothetical protein LOD99_4451 [Oopsacas minuta]|uniref:NECAP PHear domain-containing protein n=1 Tax=Oopsacas minuta TaxID=111878 RepID=A0AAV7JUP8_9METZ|nr:hypothetical protein LOD99_4451 [Oopsacas minuta]
MDYERVLLVKPTVSVFLNIPSSGGGRGHRADHWDLTKPSWVGRIRLCTYGPKCVIKLEEKTSGELFAECPVDSYPSTTIDPVIDSSRYFVVKIVNGMEHAFVGMGFDDRADSFDLRVTLQEHFRQIQKELEIKQEEDCPIPSKDYSLKEGQSIRIEFKGFKKTTTDEDTTKQEPVKVGTAVKMSGGMILPPPTAKKITTPQQVQSQPKSIPAPLISSDNKTQAKPDEDPFQVDSGSAWVKF